MQILQWLFKIAAQEPPKMVSNSTSIPPKQCDEGETDKNIYKSEFPIFDSFSGEKLKSKNIVVLNDVRGRRRNLKGVEKSKLNCENLILFRFVQRKDVSRPFFFQTLNLKGLGSFVRSRNSEKNGVSATLGGNKVLPRVDLAHSSSRNDDNINQFPAHSDNKDKTKKCKKRTASRMKELLKWSATAKVLNFKNGAASKGAMDDGEVSDESPKISIRWEMEGCPTNTTTTVYTTISTVLRASSTLQDGQMKCADTSNSSTADLQVGDECDAGIGSWITTDSEFFVLEL